MARKEEKMKGRKTKIMLSLPNPGAGCKKFSQAQIASVIFRRSSRLTS